MTDTATVGEASTHHTPAHALERLVFFSDAVFAISITLLVIELHAPSLPRDASDRDFLVTLINLWPHFLAFFVSFFVIGQFWAGHHRAFDCARHWSPKLMMPNLMLLCTIAAMPFFTALMADNYGHRVPAIAYSAWLLLTAIANLRLNSLAVVPPVAGDHIPPDRAGMIRRRGWAVIFGATTSLVAGIINPWFAQPALASMPFWRLALEAWHRRRTA